MRSKFTDNHDLSPDKSFLKQELKLYLDCLPELKTEKLEALLKKDEDIIKGAKQNVLA